MNSKLTYNPKWRENKNVCCYFCGETRSVKYTVDLCNHSGERVLTVDVCNRCTYKVTRRKKGGEDE